MSLLKILIIVILVLWGLRMLVRVLFPYLMAQFMGKMQREAQKHYQQQTGGAYQGGQSAPDGKIRIDYVPPKPSKDRPSTNGKVGEFVDFEEIK